LNEFDSEWNWLCPESSEFDPRMNQFDGAMNLFTSGGSSLDGERNSRTGVGSWFYSGMNEFVLAGNSVMPLVGRRSRAVARRLCAIRRPQACHADAREPANRRHGVAAGRDRRARQMVRTSFWLAAQTGSAMP
jgi:hypothetical protein